MFLQTTDPSGAGRVGGRQQRPLARAQERLSLGQRLDMRVDTLDVLEPVTGQPRQTEPHGHDDLTDDRGLGLEQQVVDLPHATSDDVLDGQDTGGHVAQPRPPPDVAEHGHGHSLRVRIRGQDSVFGERTGRAGVGHAQLDIRTHGPSVASAGPGLPVGSADRLRAQVWLPDASGRGPGLQMAYSKESARAAAEAEMMFVSEPIVDHSRSPSMESMITRVRAAVAAPPSRMRTL